MPFESSNGILPGGSRADFEGIAPFGTFEMQFAMPPTNVRRIRLAHGISADHHSLRSDSKRKMTKTESKTGMSKTRKNIKIWNVRLRKLRMQEGGDRATVADMRRYHVVHLRVEEHGLVDERHRR